MQTRRLALALIPIGLAFLLERVAGADGRAGVGSTAADWLQDTRFALGSGSAGGMVLALGTPQRRAGDGGSGP